MLSTRPEKFLGNIETWDVAEAKLKDALNEFTASGGGQWELNEGDGAFYGPKIDITISDALKREWQCATIQLDFQLPQNFELEYMSGDATTKPKADSKEGNKPDHDAKPSTTFTQPGPGRARPVMVHRAIIGSFERFMAIITEHFAGKWPFWLSPRQVLVIPVMPAVNDYVEEVQRLLKAQKMHADIDISGNTMQKKIRTGQLQQYNFIFGKPIFRICILCRLKYRSRWRARKGETLRQYTESRRSRDTGQRRADTSGRSHSQAQGAEKGT